MAVPRGIAIPEIRQRLFSAVEVVIDREGAGRLSGRAVTTEAGVATGLLYGHFTDFDDFLAGYVVDRAFVISSATSQLTDRIGRGNVADNLSAAVLSAPLMIIGSSTRLIAARPGLRERVHAIVGEETPGLDAIERACATYLTEEQRRGRLTETADPAALALAVVGALHHLALSPTPEGSIRSRLPTLITALLAELTPATSTRPPQ